MQFHVLNMEPIKIRRALCTTTQPSVPIKRAVWATTPHEEWGFLSRILPLSNYHRNALIIVLQCVTPSFSITCLTKDIHNHERNMWAIICIDESYIVNLLNQLGIARLFHTTHVIPLSSITNTKYVAKWNAKAFVVQANNDKSYKFMGSITHWTTLWHT